MNTQSSSGIGAVDIAKLKANGYYTIAVRTFGAILQENAGLTGYREVRPCSHKEKLAQNPRFQ